MVALQIAKLDAGVAVLLTADKRLVGTGPATMTHERCCPNLKPLD